MRLLIVGMDEPGHVGRFLYDAARSEGYDVKIVNSAHAMEGNALFRRVIWRMLKRPIRLGRFSEEVRSTVVKWNPRLLITTGLCPINLHNLVAIRTKNTKLINYSTDDPWNRSHRSRWFLNAISEYDHVFSTRRSNLSDFKSIGCRRVSWLPFAYEPSIHFPVDSGEKKWASDIAFVGGADADRIPILNNLIECGFSISLWGSYWNRIRETKDVAQGMADSGTLRKVLSNTKCALTLVRRSNRDGHAMRSFEVAAIGSPSLVEDTFEHRELFGAESENVMYFGSDEELLLKVSWFMNNPKEATLMGIRMREHIRSRPNTYRDRLRSMIKESDKL